MELVKFDTNEYQGDEVIVGKDLPKDSEYYTLKYINKCINTEEFKESITTEGITDIIVRIKDTIIKILDWIYEKIMSLVNYIKEFFYSLDKTIDTTIKSMTTGYRKSFNCRVFIRKIDRFKKLFPHILYFGDNLFAITDYIIDELSVNIEDKLINCLSQLKSNNDIHYNSLYIMDNILYFDKSFKYVVSNNGIVSEALDTKEIDYKVGLKSDVVKRLELLKEKHKTFDHTSTVNKIRNTYKELKTSIENDNNQDELYMKSLLNRINILGVQIPTNLIKTETLLIKELVDSYRFISTYTPMSPFGYAETDGIIPCIVAFK